MRRSGGSRACPYQRRISIHIESDMGSSPKPRRYHESLLAEVAIPSYFGRTTLAEVELTSLPIVARVRVESLWNNTLPSSCRESVVWRDHTTDSRLASRGRGGWLNQQHDDKPLDSIDGDLRCEAAALGLARE